MRKARIGGFGLAFDGLVFFFLQTDKGDLAVCVKSLLTLVSAVSDYLSS